MAEPVDQHQVLTFVVRLWRETDACGRGHWRGRVEDVASQQVAYVEDVAAITRLMERWTDEAPATQGSTVGRRDSFKM